MKQLCEAQLHFLHIRDTCLGIFGFIDVYLVSEQVFFLSSSGVYMAMTMIV